MTTFTLPRLLRGVYGVKPYLPPQATLGDFGAEPTVRTWSSRRWRLPVWPATNPRTRSAGPKARPTLRTGRRSPTGRWGIRRWRPSGTKPSTGFRIESGSCLDASSERQSHQPRFLLRWCPATSASFHQEGDGRVGDSDWGQREKRSNPGTGPIPHSASINDLRKTRDHFFPKIRGIKTDLRLSAQATSDRKFCRLTSISPVACQR